MNEMLPDFKANAYHSFSPRGGFCSLLSGKFMPGGSREGRKTVSPGKNAFSVNSPGGTRQQPDSARKERVWNDLVTVYSPQPPSLYPQERQDLHLPSWT